MRPLHKRQVFNSVQGHGLVADHSANHIKPTNTLYSACQCTAILFLSRWYT
jgi:hypothetical protein